MEATSLERICSELYQGNEARTPGRFPLYPDNVPEALRQRDQWMATRFEERGGGKLSKPPHCVKSGHKANKTNPASWVPFKEAKAAVEDARFDAAGYVLTANDGLVGIDLDGCLTEPGASPEEWAREYVRALSTYWEVSVSNTGLRAFCIGEKPGPRCRRGAVELYRENKFLVVTGWHLEGTPTDIRPCQDGLERLYRMTFDGENVQQVATVPQPPPGSSLADHEIPGRIMRSKHSEKFVRLWTGDTTGYESHSNADLALCAILAFWTGGDAAQIERLFTQSGLCRPKWRNRPDYRGRTIRKALEGRTEFYTPPLRASKSKARRVWKRSA